MILDFFDKGTQDLYNGVNSKLARKTLPVKLWPMVLRKFYLLDHAVHLEDLKAPPTSSLEKLPGDRQGQYFMRINQRYRVCFEWTVQGARRVEIVDYR
jgi:proteic killer suppression protein